MFFIKIFFRCFNSSWLTEFLHYYYYYLLLLLPLLLFIIIFIIIHPFFLFFFYLLYVIHVFFCTNVIVCVGFWVILLWGRVSYFLDCVCTLPIIYLTCIVIITFSIIIFFFFILLFFFSS